MNEVLYHVAAAPFEAARRLRHLPEGHRSGRLHGHGFLARVWANPPPDWATFPGAATGQLAGALQACVSALDYRDLNDILPQPTDAHLARWVRERLAVPGLAAIGLQSRRDQGADLEGTGEVQVWRRYRFEAAHRLPHVPPGHPCGRLHGHGFEVTLHVRQPPLEQLATERDAAVAGETLDALWSPLQSRLQHVCLNDLPGLENPTSEGLADWLWQRLAPNLPDLSWISVQETATAGCRYDGERYRIWKEQRFESALSLPAAPDSDPRHRAHGHSYLLRLHLTAPLDRLLGWTIDYGDVKALFQPLYRRLDHQSLDELPGLAVADPGHLARWIRQECTAVLPQLDRIDLYETPGCGASLCWGEQAPALPA